jgi:hypothetical protein
MTPLTTTRILIQRAEFTVRRAIVSRWFHWQSFVAGRYHRRVLFPVECWRACGCPESFRPVAPWWAPLVYTYLHLTGWR